MRRTLLLNATFEPLCVVSLRRAVVLVLKDFSFVGTGYTSRTPAADLAPSSANMARAD